jgi:hypothetical protein
MSQLPSIITFALHFDDYDRIEVKFGGKIEDVILGTVTLRGLNVYEIIRLQHTIIITHNSHMSPLATNSFINP